MGTLAIRMMENEEIVNVQRATMELWRHAGGC